MELPYCVFDVAYNKDIIKLSITTIDKGNPKTLKMGGLTANFSIQIEVDGITANIKCWLTVGNLFAFFTELQNCYNNLDGSAVLKYYSEDLTNISVSFSRTGQCKICGIVKSSAFSENGVIFDIRCDQTFISPNIKKLKLLFDELAIMQGFYEFDY